MAEYHVKAGGQGEGGTLPTLGAAAALVRPGDTVIIGAGVYREQLRCTVPNVTWQGGGFGPAVIDGGWDGRTNTKQLEHIQVGIGAAATLRGVTIRNCPGRGLYVGAGGDNALIEDVTIENTYNSGIALNGMGDYVENVTFRRVTVRGSSRSWAVTPPAQRQGVGGNWLFRWGKNILLEDCRLSGGYGEGPAAGVGTIGFTMRRCVIDTTMHLMTYAANRARDVLIEDCVLYQTGDPVYRQPDGQVGGGFVIGDETRWDDKDDKWQHSENVTLRRCVVVNGGGLLAVRNNVKDVGKGDPDGYETQIQNLLVERCTFIGGPDTRGGILLDENTIGPRVKGRFSENVIYVAGVAAPFRYETPGVIFSGNAWVGLPGDKLPSGDYLVGADALADPTAAIEQAAGAALNLDNYRPVAGGPLVVDGRALAGALEASTPPPPPPPPPPAGPDYTGLIEQAAAVGAELAAIGAAVNEADEQAAVAALASQTAIEHLHEAKERQDAAATRLAVLLVMIDELIEAA